MTGSRGRRSARRSDTGGRSQKVADGGEGAAAIAGCVTACSVAIHQCSAATGVWLLLPKTREDELVPAQGGSMESGSQSWNDGWEPARLPVKGRSGSGTSGSAS